MPAVPSAPLVAGAELKMILSKLPSGMSHPQEEADAYVSSPDFPEVLSMRLVQAYKGYALRRKLGPGSYTAGMNNVFSSPTLNHVQNLVLTSLLQGGMLVLTLGEVFDLLPLPSWLPAFSSTCV